MKILPKLTLIIIVLIPLIACLRGFIFNNKITINVAIVNKNSTVADPLLFSVIFKNEQDEAASYYYPSLNSTIELELIYKGEELKSPLLCHKTISPYKLDLKSKMDSTLTFDLSYLYPFLFESGDYSFHLKYQANDSLIILSNKESFTIKNLPNAENDVKVYYSSMINSEGNPKAIEYGKELLRKYPNTIFTYKIKLFVAEQLYIFGRYEESIQVFQDLLKMAKHSYSKDDLLFRLAYTYKKLEQLELAIQSLQKIEHQNHNVEMILSGWKLELQWKLRQE